MGPLHIGLMSGTSLDGVDAALVDLNQPAPLLVANHYVAYPCELRDDLLALHHPDASLDEAMRLSNRVTALYAAAVNAIREQSGDSEIAAIGCHGQTVRHRPAEGYTVQLVNGALLAERTGLTTVTDFRSRDVAAGGQGAPLVPAFHAACFADPVKTRVILNLGGIGNVTYLPAAGPVLGFDTGPGNLLLDFWAQTHFGMERDEGGRTAASGRVIDDLLSRMLDEPYFKAPPPKSTGRDDFNGDWLQRFGVERLATQDVMATLSQLTAASVANAVRAYCPGTSELFVCGGGVHNLELMRRLTSALQGIRVGSTDELGVHPDWVEAMAFAWLASRTMSLQPGNLPEVTGADGPRILGAIYPA